MDILNLGDVGRRTHIRPKENLAKDEYGMEDVEDFFKETTAIYGSDVDSSENETTSIIPKKAESKRTLGAKRKNNAPKKSTMLQSRLSMIPLGSSTKQAMEAQTSLSVLGSSSHFQWSESIEASTEQTYFQDYNLNPSLETRSGTTETPESTIAVVPETSLSILHHDPEQRQESPEESSQESTQSSEQVPDQYRRPELDQDLNDYSEQPLEHDQIAEQSHEAEKEKSIEPAIPEMDFDSGPSHFDDDIPDYVGNEQDPELPGSPILVRLDHDTIFGANETDSVHNLLAFNHGIHTPVADTSMDSHRDAGLTSEDEDTPDSLTQETQSATQSTTQTGPDFDSQGLPLSDDDSFNDQPYANDYVDVPSLLQEGSTQENTSKKKLARRKIQNLSSEVIVQPFLPSPPPEGLRRSNRKRILPLAYWRNEKVVYSLTPEEDKDPDSTLVMDVNNIPLQEIREIITVPEVPKSKTKRKKTDPKSALAAPKKQVTSLDDIFEGPDIVLEGTEWYENKVLDINVFGSNETVVKARVACSPQGIEFQQIKSTKKGILEIYKLGSIFNEDDEVMAAAYLDLPCEGIKRLHSSRNSLYYFNVVFGLVEIQLNEDKFVVLTGTTFKVPQKNNYAIRNVGLVPARLFVVQCDVSEP